MNGSRIALIAGSLALLAASCTRSSDDATTVRVPAPQSESAIANPSATPAAVSVDVEQRLGTGRAVAVASNGTQTVVATTVDIAVRDDATGAFRSIAPTSVPIRDVMISPSGDRVAVVAQAGELALWTTDDVPVLATSVSSVDGAQFRSDGALVVVGADGIRVLDGATGAVIDEWTAPPDRFVGPFAVADDGRVIVGMIGGPSPEIVTWGGGNAASPVPVDSDLDAQSVTRIVTAGDRVAVGLRNGVDGFDNRIAMFTIGADDPLWFTDVGIGVSGDAWGFGPAGGLVSGDGPTVRVLDGSGSEVAVMQTAAPVERVLDGELIVTTEGSILRLDQQNELVDVVTGNRRVAHIDVDRTRGVTTFVDALGLVGSIEPGAASAVTMDDFVAAPMNDVAVAVDGRVATASTNGVVEVRGAEVGGDATDVTRLVHDEGNVDSVAFAGDGTKIATGVAQRRAATAFDDTVSLWPADGGERIFETGGEAEDVAGCSFFTNKLRFARNGTFVVSTSHDFTVNVIAIPTGEVLHTFPPHANTVLDLAISPDDSLLVTSGDDSTMRVWDLATFELIAEHPIAMGGFWSLSFLPDGSSVVAGDLGGNLSIVDVATGATSLTFTGTKHRDSRSAVSPDGRFVAAGSDGSTVRLWSTATGQVVGEAAGHSEQVSSVAFFPDSTRLVSASHDGTAIVWRLSG